MATRTRRPNSSTTRRAMLTLAAFQKETQLDHENALESAECMCKGYKLLKTVLGTGAYAKVKLGEVLDCGKRRIKDIDWTAIDGKITVALKIVNKRDIPKDYYIKFLSRELDAMRSIPPHKNMVRMYDCFETPSFMYMVLERCDGGDLLTNINAVSAEGPFKGLGEATSKKYFMQLASAVAHCHRHGFVHRDLKCENILIDNEKNIKLTDFGFACRIKAWRSDVTVGEYKALLKTWCGSYAYACPEIIQNQNYDGELADVWSIGVVLCAMLNGKLPFDDTKVPQTIDDDMRLQRITFQKHISLDCIRFCRKILQHNPRKRPKVCDILKEPWITGIQPHVGLQYKSRCYSLTPKVDIRSHGAYRRKMKTPPPQSCLSPQRKLTTVITRHDLAETITMKCLQDGSDIHKTPVEMRTDKMKPHPPLTTGLHKKFEHCGESIEKASNNSHNRSKSRRFSKSARDTTEGVSKQLETPVPNNLSTAKNELGTNVFIFDPGNSNRKSKTPSQMQKPSYDKKESKPRSTLTQCLDDVHPIQQMNKVPMATRMAPPIHLDVHKGHTRKEMNLVAYNASVSTCPMKITNALPFRKCGRTSPIKKIQHNETERLVLYSNKKSRFCSPYHPESEPKLQNTFTEKRWSKKNLIPAKNNERKMSKKAQRYMMPPVEK
ncbi:unnamed protein product [Owenia fusiformis]|uniref:Protein kinase domain-containing protein n=1 Tax=Owenia fusiformis TaxID=6347 RepID=A0A8S4Q6H0_OWEFU|nr:unnamed protein product [Owenia fusiformis]